MSDKERSRDRHRDRKDRYEPQEGHNNRDSRGAYNERRDRSRSPRRERGGRRDNRYRSRSPVSRNERDGDRMRDRGKDGRGRDKGREESGWEERQAERARAPPNGPHTGAAPPRGKDSRFSNGGLPPTGLRAPNTSANAIKDDETSDVEMKEEKEKPEDVDDDTWEMYKTMGFGGFKSTKNTKVPGNDKNFGVRRDKQMEARQYMNRQGGFNRPLSPSRG